jgi:hypothetical protein
MTDLAPCGTQGDGIGLPRRQSSPELRTKASGDSRRMPQPNGAARARMHTERLRLLATCVRGPVLRTVIPNSLSTRCSKQENKADCNGPIEFFVAAGSVKHSEKQNFKDLGHDPPRSIEDVCATICREMQARGRRRNYKRGRAGCGCRTRAHNGFGGLLASPSRSSLPRLRRPVLIPKFTLRKG